MVGTAPLVSAKGSLCAIAVETLFLIAVMAAVPFIVYLDAVILAASISENSITEYLHNFLLLVAMIAFAGGAIKYPQMRGYLLMAVTLFSCMFIREFDSTFDKIVHGFWVFPMLAVLAGGTILVVRHRDTVVVPMLHHLQTRQATFVFIGVLMLIVFTRLFGTGSLWEPIMGADYNAAYKSTI